MSLELVFPALGNTLPTDHAYPLYAALSGVVPKFHDKDSPLRFAPITGRATPDGLLHITEHSCLRVRLPDDAVQVALPLAGKRLTIGDVFVRLGVPSVRTLVAAPWRGCPLGLVYLNLREFCFCRKLEDARVG